jgi:hypothetical protein
MKTKRPNFKTIFVAAATAMFLLACKPLLEMSTTAYIVGPTNDIKQIKSEDLIENDITDIANASVLIATTLKSQARKFCSGTLIKDMQDRTCVLTNHHCFAEVNEEQMVSDQLIAEACVETKVYFGFHKDNALAVQEGSCLKDSLRTNPLGDLALFCLAEAPPAEAKTLTIAKSPVFDLGVPALIVHYPDVPENRIAINNTAVKLPSASLTIEDCKTDGVFNTQNWKHDRALPFAIRHTCDLIKGSSGSALIDRSSKEIIGVNWGGIALQYSDRTDTINVATHSDYIQAFLENRTEDLIKQANLRLTSTASSPNLARQKANAKSDVPEGCGTLHVGLASSSQWFMMLLLFLPFAAIIPRK